MIQDPIQLDTPIVLVGMMGAGKTTVGLRLAKRLDVPFIDTDAEMEKTACCSIADIYHYAGEDYYRDLERKTITKFIKETKYPAVISTGGGAFSDKPIRDCIVEHAISVWIKADIDTLVDRVTRRKSRPLLEQGNPERVLHKLMKEHYPIYEEADIIIESNESTHHTTVSMILDAIDSHINKKEAG